jgi:hypothetical protein
VSRNAYLILAYITEIRFMVMGKRGGEKVSIDQMELKTRKSS